jgi:hypothetical protein
MLVRLCQHALQRNFGYPEPAVPRPAFCVADWLVERVGVLPHLAATPLAVSLTCTGPGGGSWTIAELPGGNLAACEGASRGAGELRLQTRTLQQVIEQGVAMAEARQRGLVAATLTEAQWHLICRLVAARAGKRTVTQPAFAGTDNS